MTCEHNSAARMGHDRGFSGPVYTLGVTDENRAAHGWLTYTEECCTCGARRDVAANQAHYEYSAWGPDRATRQAEATAAAFAARSLYERAPEPKRVTLPSGCVLTVAVDRDGYLSVTGDLHTDSEADAAAAASGLAEFARVLRTQHERARALAADVDQP